MGFPTDVSPDYKGDMHILGNRKNAVLSVPYLLTGYS